MERLTVFLFCLFHFQVLAQPVFEKQQASTEMAFTWDEQPQAIKAYQKKIDAALALNVPILVLDNLPAAAQQAQSLAVAHPDFIRYVRRPQDQAPLRNEIMVVRLALPSDLVGQAAKCSASACYRVEMYNFFLNLASVAIVDVQAQQVVSVTHNPNSQPELSQRLHELALAIAGAHPRIKDLTKWANQVTGPLMGETKTALNKSRCERSRHLCVAPTYVVDDRALWVITDLTDMRIVGIKWTALGAYASGVKGPPPEVTERTLQNEHVFLNYCEKSNQINRLGWQFDYGITSSDGLRIANVTFNKQHVINDAKVVDWHVSYSLRDGFGYSDSTGCPLFSAGVVVAYNPPEIKPIIEQGKEVGFSLIQDFRQLPWPAPCNYRYQQHYQFYQDGRFRMVMGDLGRGCGMDGTYRPVLRVDVGKAANGKAYQVQHWQQATWQTWQDEAWSLQDKSTEYQQGKYTHRLMNTQGQGFLIEPGNGQFEDGGRGDQAFTYFTVSHPDKDEGHSDLVTLGACCNTDYQQGPELFMQPAESLVDQALIMWYVPQLKNDGLPGQQYCWADTVVRDGVVDYEVWPCYAGPMFTPINISVSASNDG